MTRLALLVVAAVLLASCTAWRTPSPPPPASGRVAPSLQQQAQRNALAAVELLESGNEERALAEIRRALATDPQNRLAQNLQRQITADPVAALGRDSFAYTLRPNDTLSGLAARFLGDGHAFYILARYNGIRVPRQVTGGQVIRIPGRAPVAPVAPEPRRPTGAPPPAPVVEAVPVPVPSAVPAPVADPAPAPVPSLGEQTLRAAEAAERAGDIERAYNGYRRAAALDQPGAAARADAARRKLVARLSADARGALARQDLDGSIRHWDRVLELDPDNDTARLERQRAVALSEKLKSLK